MNITNLTPHPITLRSVMGVDTIIPPTAPPARVSATPGTLATVPGLPVPVASATVYGEIEGLPPPAEGTVFIVSGIVLPRCAGRTDVCAPGTGPADGAIRDERGQIVAVTRLIAAPQ